MRVKKVEHRNAPINCIDMYYALYSDKIPILDSDGNPTFENRIGYENPVPFKACLSTGQSDAEEKPFGNDVSYDRVISNANTTLPIDENSIIWVKNIPTYNADGTVNGDSADYKVAALPLDGLNSLRIAIKKVSKSNVVNSSDNVETSENEGNTDESDGF